MNRRQRRELAKKKKSKDRNVATWRGLHKYEKVRQEEPEELIPGYNAPPEHSPEFKIQFENNIWHNIDKLDSFIQVIKKLSVENDWTWSWARNSDCKYVNLRFDMRDGGFIMTNRENQRIDIPQLEFQFRRVKETTGGTGNELVQTTLESTEK